MRERFIVKTSKELETGKPHLFVLGWKPLSGIAHNTCNEAKVEIEAQVPSLDVVYKIDTINEMSILYDVTFHCGYRIIVTAENEEDGITVAKGYAIEAGHVRPTISKIISEMLPSEPPICNEEPNSK
jgi:hypothetical protein